MEFRNVLIIFFLAVQLSFGIEDKRNGIPCETDQDCDGLNGKCIDNICQCNSTVCIDEENRVVTKIGEACKFSKDCNIQESDCISNICSCSKGRTETLDLRKCLKISEGLGDVCEDTVQCHIQIPNSVCLNSKCLCQQRTHEFNGSCYKDVGLGYKCSNDGNCSKIQFSKCINEKCGCMKDYVVSGNRCLRIASGEKDSCQTNIQCTESLGGSSHCVNGFCACKDLFQVKPKTNKCVRDLLLGETCVTHQECHGPIPGESRLECILGECKCQSKYREEDGYCISSASSTKYSIFIVVLVLSVTYFIKFL